MQRDCVQADEQLTSLIRSTEKCFSHKNYPLNTVARRIKNDVNSLRKVIVKLENGRLAQEGQHHNNHHNTNQHSYNFSTIKATTTSDDKWCHYKL